MPPRRARKRRTARRSRPNRPFRRTIDLADVTVVLDRPDESVFACRGKAKPLPAAKGEIRHPVRDEVPRRQLSAEHMIRADGNRPRVHPVIDKIDDGTACRHQLLGRPGVIHAPDEPIEVGQLPFVQNAILEHRKRPVRASARKRRDALADLSTPSAHMLDRNGDLPYASAHLCAPISRQTTTQDAEIKPNT